MMIKGKCSICGKKCEKKYAKGKIVFECYKHREARVEVVYNPKKLKCEQCGNEMTEEKSTKFCKKCYHRIPMEEI